MSRTPYEELSWQLARLPGGVEAAMPDFFGHLLAGPPEATATAEVWSMVGGARLELRGDQLSASLNGATTAIATLPQALMNEALKAGISPLLLGLLALATGDVDGDRSLKALLPRVEGAAKDLMLMTVCRLCG